jgi:hypothetical protein
MLPCESVCTHYPSPGFGVHVALWVCLYTITLSLVWCSCCSVNLSVHNNPPLGLVFMLLCEFVCTQYPSIGFGVHVALWVCLYTITLPWVWCSCCSVRLSVHTAPPLGLVFMLPCVYLHNTPPLGLVFILLCVCLYTISLPWVWCSCCSVSVYTLPLPCESVCAQYGTPPMGLVFMLLSLLVSM